MCLDILRKSSLLLKYDSLWHTTTSFLTSYLFRLVSERIAREMYEGNGKYRFTVFQMNYEYTVYLCTHSGACRMSIVLETVFIVGSACFYFLSFFLFFNLSSFIVRIQIIYKIIFSFNHHDNGFLAVILPQPPTCSCPCFIFH